MSVLNREQKTFIVQQLAMYKTPQQVADLVKETFGVEIPRQQVFLYRRENHQLATVWQVVFDETRRKFLETISDIPIANQAYRIQQLQDSLNRQLNNGRRINEVMVQNILEQAAKEVGGMFTNQRQITGANGKPLVDTEELARSIFKELTTEEGWKEPDALKWVVERYKVPESVIVSNAIN